MAVIKDEIFAIYDENIAEISCFGWQQYNISMEISPFQFFIFIVILSQFSPFYRYFDKIINILRYFWSGQCVKNFNGN